MTDEIDATDDSIDLPDQYPLSDRIPVEDTEARAGPADVTYLGDGTPVAAEVRTGVQFAGYRQTVTVTFDVEDGRIAVLESFDTDEEFEPYLLAAIPAAARYLREEFVFDRVEADLVGYVRDLYAGGDA